MKIIYQSYRDFKIWGYTVSHSSLLLRSPMKFIDEDGFSEDHSFNVDIEFSSVTFIAIPSLLKGLKIREIAIDVLPSSIDRALCKYGQKIFEIQQENKQYYIIAGGLLVGRNTWVNEDRLLNYDMNMKHEIVIVEI